MSLEPENEASGPAERGSTGQRVDQLLERAWKEVRRGMVPPPEKVAMLIARDIVRQIGSGRVSSGDPLASEVEMASSYEVGRTSIREALRILEVQGLVHIKTGAGGGPIVTDPTSAYTGRVLSMHMNVRGYSFEELFLARREIDPHLARLAAENATPEAIARLREVVELMDGLLDADGREWARVSSMFAAVVAAMTGNGVLALISTSLRAILSGMTLQLTRTAREMALGNYRQVAEAIARHDGAEAERCYFALIDNALQRMAKHHPEYLTDTIDWR